MDASILIFGGDSFLATVLKPIHDLAASTVEVAGDPCEAAPLIQAQQPDILIMQVRQTGSLDLCQQIKAQNRLAWIYCIAVDDQFYGAEALPIFDEQAKFVIEVLEAGADAYLSMAHGDIGDKMQHDDAEQLKNRLLQTQIHVGLRRVHHYRELMRTNDLLSAIALSDPLTELNNRRALEWELPRQIQNARGRGMPISLVMLDVDFFKTINDTYGHLVGDCALKLIAARLRHNLRFYDTPFRYGGEEFVIILSETTWQEANAIAHRLCHLIADQPFVIDDTLDLTITISAGATSLTTDDDAKGISLLKRADHNLLKAKSQGRNRVVGCQDIG